LPTDAFLYLGYLPRKPGERRRLLLGIAELPYTLIFLETPHRLLAAFQDLVEILGDRDVAVARELTKLHEEIFRGTLRAAKQYFSDNPAGNSRWFCGYRAQNEQWSPNRCERPQLKPPGWEFFWRCCTPDCKAKRLDTTAGL
jgi:16S rRNA C1402 (ribose-2'-O) methylase RsmI